MSADIVSDRNKFFDEILDAHCKAWCYQLERGEKTGYEHYQGRFSLKVKERENGVVRKFPGFSISITSTANKDNMFYVMKSKTQIAGPWTEDDKPVYVPRQLLGKVLRPWQRMVVDDGDTFDERHINVVVDNVGNHGKTLLGTWLIVHKKGRSIPYANDFRDIMRMVMNTKKCKLYVFDIPRSISKEKMYGFFSGVEKIKDGYAFDDRYKFNEQVFDCPNIWVFMNKKPDDSYLSRDRWRFWAFEGEVLVRTF